MPFRGSCAAALFLLGVARPSSAQYPLVPSPVLRLESAVGDPSVSGYLSVRHQYINDSASFVVNRARVTLQVRALPQVSLRIQTDLSGLARTDSSQTAVVLTDAYIQLSPLDTAGFGPFMSPAVIAGQFRTPFSLEFLTSFSLLQSANRSEVVNRLATRRDIGIIGQTWISGFAVLSAAVVNGAGPNVTVNADDRQMTVGRVTLLPLHDLAVATKVAVEGRSRIWGYDARWIHGKTILEAEVIRRTVQGRDTEDSGEYALASYKLLQWLQPVIKWERLNVGGVAPERRRKTMAGLNIASDSERLRLQVNWVDVSTSGSRGENEFFVQLISIF